MSEDAPRITKIISFAIGMSGSVKPEVMALKAYEELSKQYKITKLEGQDGSADRN